MTTLNRHPVPRLIALPELLAVGRDAAHPVAHDGRRLLLWSEFAARVAGLSERLRADPAQRWLLASDDALNFAVELFAALHAGKQAVIPPNTLPGTLAALAGAYDARFADSDALPAGDTPALAPAPLSVLDAQAAVIDIYTSGSTGEHKRIRKTLAQFDAEVAVLEALWGATAGAAAVIATAPHQHIYGLLFRLFWPLASGRVFDARHCAQPDALAERLAALAPALLISSPAQLTRLPELLPLAALPQPPVAVFSSGGPLPASAARAIGQALGQAPIEIFGSTETGGVAWRQREADTASAGHDVGNAEDEAWTPFPGHALSCAADGALTLRSAFLADGGPWRMDDAVELLADGRFRLRGRLDRVVKIEEKRLALPDMEARLTAHAWVESAAVVALPAGNVRRQTLGALIVLNARGRARYRGLGRRALTQLLRRHLAAYFDAVLLPRRWRFPRELPRNERGKLANGALQELLSTPESDDAPAGDPALLPTVERVAYAADDTDAVVIDLYVAPNIAYFAGHFPGAELLPGVVQIDWAVRLARRYLAIEGTFSALDNVKFLGVILPDTHLKLSLAWDGERRRLDFTYSDAQRRYSSGRIVLAGQR